VKDPPLVYVALCNRITIEDWVQNERVLSNNFEKCIQRLMNSFHVFYILHDSE
jgi:hypothetical protein